VNFHSFLYFFQTTIVDCHLQKVTYHHHLTFLKKICNRNNKFTKKKIPIKVSLHSVFYVMLYCTWSSSFHPILTYLPSLFNDLILLLKWYLNLKKAFLPNTFLHVYHHDDHLIINNKKRFPLAFSLEKYTAWKPCILLHAFAWQGYDLMAGMAQKQPFFCYLCNKLKVTILWFQWRSLHYLFRWNFYRETSVSPDKLALRDFYEDDEKFWWSWWWWIKMLTVERERDVWWCDVMASIKFFLIPVGIWRSGLAYNLFFLLFISYKIS